MCLETPKTSLSPVPKSTPPAGLFPGHLSPKEFAPVGGGERGGGETSAKLCCQRRGLSLHKGTGWSGVPHRTQGRGPWARGRGRSWVSWHQAPGRCSFSASFCLVAVLFVLFPATQLTWQDAAALSSSAQSPAWPNGNVLASVPKAQERKADGGSRGPDHPSPRCPWSGRRHRINMVEVSGQLKGVPPYYRPGHYPPKMSATYRLL